MARWLQPTLPGTPVRTLLAGHDMVRAGAACEGSGACVKQGHWRFQEGRSDMGWLRRLTLCVAFVACLAPMAHVLEMPNKLRLEGGLWLDVQQNLYSGWGPLIGGPTEVGGLVATLVLLVASRRRTQPALLYGIAALGYIAMLLCFFLLNAPVNAALDEWTPATLPSGWSQFRLRWELGHTLAALFAVVAFAAIGRATRIDSPPTADRAE